MTSWTYFTEFPVTSLTRVWLSKLVIVHYDQTYCNFITPHNHKGDRCSPLFMMIYSSSGWYFRTLYTEPPGTGWHIKCNTNTYREITPQHISSTWSTKCIGFTITWISYLTCYLLLYLAQGWHSRHLTCTLQILYSISFIFACYEEYLMLLYAYLHNNILYLYPPKHCMNLSVFMRMK